MAKKSFRELLEEANDKFSVFTDTELLDKYDLNIVELSDLITSFFSDEEKARLFDFPYFQNLESWVKRDIAKLITDEAVLLNLLNNENFTTSLPSYHLVNIVESLSSTSKLNLLRNESFIQNSAIDEYDISDIIASLDEADKLDILSDNDLVLNTFKLEPHNIRDILKTLLSDDKKLELAKLYSLEGLSLAPVISSLKSDEKKEDIIFNENTLDKTDIKDILVSFAPSNLIDFINYHKDFLHDNDIDVYEITRLLSPSSLEYILSHLSTINLNPDEIKKIFVTLNNDIKQKLDRKYVPADCIPTLTMEMSDFSTRLTVDFDRNLEDYRGLDNLIYVNPEHFTDEQKKRFLELCDICPNLTVINILNKSVEFFSTPQEYKEGEAWIDSVLSSIPEDYSQAQKLALIDNAIGKRISYSPDFDTEVFDTSNARALWKIISSGYGICNGIANVEKYLLDRVGIESEQIGSKSHAFLKIKNIDLPLASGETVRGTTILDPTWNLTNQRFNSRPANFCISYEQARKNDIAPDGKDHYCHKNDKDLQDATLGLDVDSLRALYKSVGLAHEDGNFPIIDLLKKSNEIDKICANNPVQNLNNQLLLLSKVCPDFALCQNSSMKILANLLAKDNLNLNKCVIDRVYKKDDNNKSPYMYVYVSSRDFGKKFFIVDKDLGNFLELSPEEFTRQYECYETDLQKSDRN